MNKDIQERIASARADHATGRKVFGGALLALLALSGGVLLLSRQALDAPPQDAAQQAAKLPEEAPGRAGQRQGAAATGAGTAAGAGEAPEQREAYKVLLKRFDGEHLPALAAASAPRWASAPWQGLQEDREASLGAFEQGNYAEALRVLQGAEQEAQALLARAESDFAKHLKAARAAFRAEDADAAERHINRALLLKAEHPEARALFFRIEILPDVLRELRAARRARAENRPAQEKAALERALQLDGERTELRVRIAALGGDMAEQDFLAAVDRGFRALDAGDLKAAEAALARADAIFPGRSERALLEDRVRAFGLRQTLGAHLEQAEQAGAADNWASASRAFQNALRLDETHERAQSGLALARRILAAQSGVDDFLARPERLSSENIEAAARALLARSAQFDALSPRLARSAEALRGALERATTEVSLFLKSDNRTEILVRGVGQVGKIREKTLSLRPGVYTLEGRRKGYRSKLVEVRLEPGAPASELTLVCDERIPN